MDGNLGEPELDMIEARENAIDTHLNEGNLQGLRNMIILDSGATEHTFCNDVFLWNIEASSHALDLHTNVESRAITRIGRFGDYDGDIWCDPDGIANVISLSRLTNEGYRVYVDTNDDDVIFVYNVVSQTIEKVFCEKL